MGKSIKIDAKGVHYTPLNKMLRKAVADGVTDIVLDNILGQRFIGNGLRGDDVKIRVNGVPGGDLAMFMSGPEITVYGNCDHAPGNTMDSGRVIIHGSTGDATAHSMRGGEVYVRDDIGYRGGIHMKEYQVKRPVLVVGGCARAFLGEYMAGGLLIVLGLNGESPVNERGVGSGIHGGKIILRGDIEDSNLGIGARKEELKGEDLEDIRPYIENFSKYFGLNSEEILKSKFIKIIPASARPFANKYCWE
jgi:glutamate synthase domain-containing protein 3